jgi:hypothetical protein
MGATLPRRLDFRDAQFSLSTFSSDGSGYGLVFVFGLSKLELDGQAPSQQT